MTLSLASSTDLCILHLKHPALLGPHVCFPLGKAFSLEFEGIIIIRNVPWFGWIKDAISSPSSIVSIGTSPQPRVYLRHRQSRPRSPVAVD